MRLSELRIKWLGARTDRSGWSDRPLQRSLFAGLCSDAVINGDTDLSNSSPMNDSRSFLPFASLASKDRLNLEPTASFPPVRWRPDNHGSEDDSPKQLPEEQRHTVHNLTNNSGSSTFFSLQPIFSPFAAAAGNFQTMKASRLLKFCRRPPHHTSWWVSPRSWRVQPGLLHRNPISAVSTTS